MSPISRTYEMIAVVTWSRFFLSWAACTLTQLLCVELGIKVAPYYDKLRQQIAKTDFMYKYYNGFYSFSREQEFEFLKCCHKRSTPNEIQQNIISLLPNEIQQNIISLLRPNVRGKDVRELKNPQNISWQSENTEGFSFERTVYAKEGETDSNLQEQAARTSQLLVEKRAKIASSVQCIFMVALFFQLCDVPFKSVELSILSEKNTADFIFNKSDECRKNIDNIFEMFLRLNANEANDLGIELASGACQPNAHYFPFFKCNELFSINPCHSFFAMQRQLADLKEMVDFPLSYSSITYKKRYELLKLYKELPTNISEPIFGLKNLGDLGKTVSLITIGDNYFYYGNTTHLLLLDLLNRESSLLNERCLSAKGRLRAFRRKMIRDVSGLPQKTQAI